MRVFQQDRTGDDRDRKARTSRSKRLGGLVVLLALLVAAGWAWILLRQEQILGWRLAQARQHAETCEREIDSLLRTIGQERVKLTQARQATAEADRDTAATATAREQAEAEQRAAAEQAEQSRQQAEQARAEAELAEQEKKEIRAERQAELARMQQAMGHIVKTTPAPWGMTIDLGRPEALFHEGTATLDRPGREILSRLAGAFLASHGYRIALRLRDPMEDPKTSQLLEKRLNAVHDYLLEAGLPPEIISMSVSGKDSTPKAADGWIEVRVVDTILPENRVQAAAK